MDRQTDLESLKIHQKASKGIKRHQKASKGIERHRKTSKDIERHLLERHQKTILETFLLKRHLLERFLLKSHLLEKRTFSKEISQPDLILTISYAIHCAKYPIQHISAIASEESHSQSQRRWVTPFSPSCRQRQTGLTMLYRKSNYHMAVSDSYLVKS